jgi:hypothetical protein
MSKEITEHDFKSIFNLNHSINTVLICSEIQGTLRAIGVEDEAQKVITALNDFNLAVELKYHKTYGEVH